MKTGFVILNYNSWKMAKNLAQKAAAYNNIDAVVVVDNFSTDDSYEYLKQMNHEKIHVRQTQKNGGYSYGNNYGAKICRKLGMEIVFISNPDVAVEEAHIQKILAQFEDTDYSVLSGVEYDIHGKMPQLSLWKRKGYWDDFWDCFYLGRKLGRKNPEIKLDKNVTVQRTEMVKGSFFAVRLEDFIDVGGFDERIFLYCEERILSKKMEDSGRKIGIVTNAEYIHTHSASIQQEYKQVSQQMQILYQSRLYYHEKYSRIGRAKYGLLFVAMKISVFEYGVRDFIRFVGKTLERV